ncbi:MAG TPA: T9SS type A sorting domain-containing protein [Bacteroidetes bacterium]|nr:T9SS type A sorting domain-containing protein [Bacteroidota bacterium]
MVRIRHATVLLALLLAGTLGQSAAAQGPAPGNCTLGNAEADLDINNIFARVFNTGSLFFGNTTTAGDGYLAPQASGNSPIFASGLWVGGKVNGDLRVAGSRYSGFTFWPGPLGNDGRPVDPNNCEPYDRIYRVSRIDIANYEAGLGASRDLADWPVELGAPVVDGDGDPTNYNLDGGDRPDIIGDQGLWWVMNDVGGEHSTQQTDPLGIEVRVLAFSFSRADALGSTTFYKYTIINKSGVAIEDTYVSIFSDPDLGDAVDDYVGYDAELGMGYVYNGADEDAAYGIPPAAGYDFFQGPIVDGDTLDATAYSYFQNATSGPTIDPATGEEIYNYMQGLWKDGTPMYAFGDGYNQPQAPVTKFAFPGDPVTGEFWSEVNNDGNGTANAVGDRRFAIHTGPFTLQPNDPQEIVFGIVFAQGSDRFSSISALRSADQLAQTAYDNDFRLAPPPPAPPKCSPNSDILAPGSGNCLEAAELDGEVTLVWGYPSNSANYLGTFEVVDVLLDPETVTDNTYNFEGFNIYRYPTSNFDESARQLVATYDIANGVTQVVDLLFDEELGDLAPTVVARGTDSGVQYSYRVQNLTNSTDYFYGVSAYAYNEESTPKVIESAPTQITVRPSMLAGGDQTQATYGESSMVSVITQRGGGVVEATIVDPTAVTGADYEVRFFESIDDHGTPDDDSDDTPVTNYSIVNVATGETVVDGASYFERTGNVLPQGSNIVVVDGISFTVSGPEPSVLYFSDGATPAYIEVQNAAGTEVCTAGSTDAGCAELNGAGNNVYHSLNSTSTYYFSEAGTGSEPQLSLFAPEDFEIRFTDEGGLAAYLFQAPYNVIRVPFEVWAIGPTGGGVNDPSDDVQIIPFLFADGNGTCEFNYGEIAEEATFGYPATDRIYAYFPADSYDAFEAAYETQVDTAPDNCFPAGAQATLLEYTAGNRPIQRQVFADFAGTGELPGSGTIVRMLTTKPNLPGDVFRVSTSGSEFVVGDEAATREAIENIQVVPNPYLGTSDYETGNLSRVVRFTNLPDEAATIRIYTVAGTLVKTLRKEGQSRSLDWNLETENNLPVASGMYLIHVEIDGIGEKVLKLGVVQRRTQIDVF